MQSAQNMSTHVDQLNEACRVLGLTPTDIQQKQILEYLSQLLKWNKTYNLTAIRDADQALIQHIFDSLSIVPILEKQRKKQQNKDLRLLDVGSGAGLPGIVIAIMVPEIKVTCVDTVEKKMTFVRQMGGVLKINNLEALHGRVENMSRVEYDIVTSRAFASLSDFANLAGQQVVKDGYLLAMKGKEPKEEIKELETKTKWLVETVQTLTVPQLNAQRCLVWMKRRETQ